MLTKDNRFNIIHISDTHVCQKNLSDLVRIKNALISDVKKHFTEKEISSSIVCFTGDLIQRGDYGFENEHQYGLIEDNLILPLIEELGIDLKKFFIVPGNHEIDKSKIDPIYQKGLNEELREYNGELNFNYKASPLHERFEGYKKFIGSLSHSYSDEIVATEKIVVNNQKLGVCLINTSWNLISDSANEQGCVIIGKNFLYNALQKMKDCDYKICLLHHSVSWLRDEDIRGVEPLLCQFDIVLYGHSHYSSEKQIISPNGQTVFCMASELLPLSKETGYNLIRVDGNICTVMQRQFFSQRDVFDSNLQVENGCKLFNVKEEDDQALIFNARLKTRQGFKEKIDSLSITSLIDNQRKTFDSYYVVPNLVYDIEATLETSKKKDPSNFITPQEIVQDSHNYIIYGKKEYGKTSLIFYLAYQYYQDIEEKKIPIIIDCKKLKNDEKGILKEIRSYLCSLSEDDYKISLDDIVRMLNTGNCVLLIDDFSTDLDCVDKIAKFVQEYSKNKRIFTTPQTASDFLENKVAEELGDQEHIKYKRIYMQYMSKNDIRKMAGSLSTCNQSELTVFTDKIISCFNKTYLPRTPFAVSLVVAVCNINSDFEPVNLAAVVKRFLEIVMDRLSPKELLSNEYNFDIKEDFLAFIAYQMVENNMFEVPIDIFDKWNLEYHEFNGFSIRDSHFDQYFFVCNILAVQNNKVYFKYKCLLEYYIGKRATIDDGFLSKILAEDRYYNFIQELIYCTGIDTRNPKIIQILGAYLDSQIEESKIDSSFISGDRIKLNCSVDEKTIQVSVIDNQMTEAEVDMATDTEDNSSEYLPATIDKQFAYDTQKYEADQFNDLLMAFGNAVRNNELSGLPVRTEAYKTYVKGTMYWCNLLVSSVEEFIKIVRRDLFEDDDLKGKIDINKVEEVFRDFCRIAIPIMAEGNMFENIGSKKLGKVFVEYYRSISNYNSLEKFFALLMICDLKFIGWKEILEDFMENNTSKDLNIILFFKVIHLYRICHFGKVNNNYIADKLFELNKKIDKTANALHGLKKTQFLNDLRKSQIAN